MKGKGAGSNALSKHEPDEECSTERRDDVLGELNDRMVDDIVEVSSRADIDVKAVLAHKLSLLGMWHVL